MFPEDPERRRIAELCGLDPDAILAARNARPVEPPRVGPGLQEALELAGDDAFRLEQTEIGPENLLFGLLRCGGLPAGYFTKVSRIDLDRFRADYMARMLPANDRVERPKLTLDPDAKATIQKAIEIATERRREMVHGHHLLAALTQPQIGPVADLLAKYGSSAASLNAELKNAL
jgi:ATP-dependent Clp protease ATP-binding subunit ClpA